MLARQAMQDQPVHRASKAILVWVVRRGNPEESAVRDQLGRRARPAVQDPQDLQELRAQRVLKAERVVPADRALLVVRDQQDRWVSIMLNFVDISNQ